MAEEQNNRLRDGIEITLVPGIGLQTQGRLWTRHRDPSELFSLKAKDLEAMGVSADASVGLTSRRYRPMADEILNWASRENCAVLLRGETGYPSLLQEVFDPPLILYARGRLEVAEFPSVAIVGTRRPTFYGLQMAQGLAADLAERGVGVISGLARGIDGASHRGCLDAGGTTIGVLGCGIDIVYPREHRNLTERILKNGLLLSEFPPGTSPSPQNFPVRNRIISGLGLGTLIVEASEYSGSLITARLAMEQNREVFALPGNITSPQSFGPNFLIKQGAKLVQSWRDIVEEFPAEIRHEILAKEDLEPVRCPELELLSDEEIRLLGVLQLDKALQFDLVFRAAGLEISRLSDLLLGLEMRGWIRQLPGNLYLKVAKRLK